MPGYLLHLNIGQRDHPLQRYASSEILDGLKWLVAVGITKHMKLLIPWDNQGESEALRKRVETFHVTFSFDFARFKARIFSSKAIRYMFIFPGQPCLCTKLNPCILAVQMFCYSLRRDVFIVPLLPKHGCLLKTMIQVLWITHSNTVSYIFWKADCTANKSDYLSDALLLFYSGSGEV